MRDHNFQDTEYRSYYYTNIRHEDDWNERVRRTREVKVGEDEHGNPIYEEEEYYETVYHPEEWYKFDNKGLKHYITKSEFNELKHIWNTKERFVDLHRHYYTIDGDAQEYDFCGHWIHIRGYTEEHSYENRVCGSNSVLKFREITKEEAKELGLYDYSSASVMGYQEGSKKIEYLNMFYGKDKQIHIKVLVFPASRSAIIAEDQKAYWQGGNKNEFVICIGARGKKIEWAECFSWQDNTELDVRCRNWLMETKKLDLIALGTWLEGNLKLWKRKEFKDFSYINSYLSSSQNMAILITILIISILSSGCSIYYIEENG